MKKHLFFKPFTPLDTVLRSLWFSKTSTCTLSTKHWPSGSLNSLIIHAQYGAYTSRIITTCTFYQLTLLFMTLNDLAILEDYLLVRYGWYTIVNNTRVVLHFDLHPIAKFRTASFHRASAVTTKPPDQHRLTLKQKIIFHLPYVFSPKRRSFFLC